MNQKTYSCCFTGYRPHKYPFSFDGVDPAYLEMENALTETVFSLPKEGFCTFYTGAAMGFDLMAAETVLLCRKALGKGIVKLVCVVPFLGQENSYTPEWKARYDRVLAAADEVITLSEVYTRDCYQKRNRYMVDRSDLVLTWFDGQSGGTKNTLSYAKRQGRRILNLNSTEDASSEPQYIQEAIF